MFVVCGCGGRFYNVRGPELSITKKIGKMSCPAVWDKQTVKTISKSYQLPNFYVLKG